MQQTQHTGAKHKQAKGEHRLIKTFFKKFLQKQQLRDENSLLNTETQHYISNEML